MSDDVHDLGGVGLLPPLIHDGQGHVQLLGEGPGPGHGAHVGGDHHGVVPVILELAVEVVHKDGGTQHIVHGDVEKALDLVGVEVHGQHPVGARPGDEVGHQLGGDGVAGFGLAVLPGVAEVGDHGGDPPGGGPLQRVDHDEKLHQVVVHRGAGGLDDKHVGAADGLINGDKILAVGKSASLGVAQGDAQLPANVLGQGPVGAAGEDFQILAV